MERGNRTFGEDPIPMEKITQNLTRQSEKASVGNALEKSLEAVSSLPSDNSRALVLAEITDLLLDSDLVYLAKRLGEKAVDSSDGIKIRAEKAKTLSKIASTFAEHDFGQISDKIFEKALKETEGIEDRRKKVDVLLFMIEEQLDRDLEKKIEGNLNRAFSVALELAERNGDIVPLAMVSETTAKIDVERAENICWKVLGYVDDLELEDDRGWVMSSVAKAFSRIGKQERSMELIKELIYAECGDIPLVEAAMTFSDEGQNESALKLRTHVKNKELRDSLTGKIAVSLILESSVDEALTLIEDIEDGFEKDLVLKNLVSHHAVRDRRKAMKHLQEIRSPEMKSVAYMELANSYLEEDHRRVEELALKAREMIADSNTDAVKLELIETLIKIELIDQAVELAGEIITDEERAIAFGTIAARCY